MKGKKILQSKGSVITPNEDFKVDKRFMVYNKIFKGHNVKQSEMFTKPGFRGM